MSIFQSIGKALGGINPLIGYGLMSGVGSLASGLYNNVQGLKQSKELMDYQYQLQQKAIDAQNLYNSPAEQVKRLASAGLSPNLVYGSGVDGNQSSAASPAIANRRSEIGNPLQDFGQAYLQAKQLQMQQIAARNEAFESRARRLNLEAKTLGVLSDNKLKDATLETNVKIASQKLSNMIAGEYGTWANTRKTEAFTENLWKEADLLQAKYKLTSEQALTEVVKRAALAAGIHLSYEQAREVGHRIRYYDAGSNLREQQYDIQETEWEATNELDKWLAEHPGVQLTEQVIDRIIDKVARVAGNGSRRRGNRKSKRRK